MANQRTTSHSRKPIVRAIFFALVLVLIFGMLDGPARDLSCVLSSAARQALVLLPTLALTAWQALLPDTFGSPRCSPCALETLVFWPLLGAAAKLG